jgi:hypothetical protein
MDRPIFYDSWIVPSGIRDELAIHDIPLNPLRRGFSDTDFFATGLRSLLKNRGQDLVGREVDGFYVEMHRGLGGRMVDFSDAAEVTWIGRGFGRDPGV